MNRLSERFSAMSLRRRAAAVLTALLVIAVLVGIFLLSAEGKAASAGRSGRLIGRIVTLLYGRDLTPEAHAAHVAQLQTFVRKCAHMTEYAVLTAAVAALLVFLRPLWDKPRRWVEWVIPFAVCAAYAASDEIHQIYSHRGPAVTDVLIDCAGGLVGLCLLQALVLAASRYRARRRAEKNQSPQGETPCS